MRTWIASRCMAYGLAAVCLFVSKDTSADDRTMIKVKISDAWKKRQTELQSVRFRWTERRFYSKGSLDEPIWGLEQLEDAKRRGRKPFPPKKCVLDAVPVEMLLSGKWMRLTRPSVRRGVDDAIRLDTYISAFDGESSRMLFRFENRLDGTIRDESRNTDAPSFPVKPITLFARAFDRSFGSVDWERCAIRSKPELVNERSCYVVELDHTLMWVDLDRNCVIVRWQEMRKNGAIVYQADLDYVSHETLGYVPSKWRILQMDLVFPDAIQSSTEAAVTEINPEV